MFNYFNYYSLQITIMARVNNIDACDRCLLNRKLFFSSDNNCISVSVMCKYYRYSCLTFQCAARIARLNHCGKCNANMFKLVFCY